MRVVLPIENNEAHVVIHIENITRLKFAKDAGTTPTFKTMEIRLRPYGCTDTMFQCIWQGALHDQERDCKNSEVSDQKGVTPCRLHLPFQQGAADLQVTSFDMSLPYHLQLTMQRDRVWKECSFSRSVLSADWSSNYEREGP